MSIMDISMEYYQSARCDAALVEQDWVGGIKLTGSDRQSWLQSMVTNDVAKLQPGEGCYAGHLNAQGKLVAQMMVLMEADAITLVLERAAIGKLTVAFDKLIIMEDVQVQEVSDEYSVLGVIGPASVRVLESWLGESPALDRAYSHRGFPDCRVVRSELGYDVWIRRELSGKTLDLLVECGARVIDRGTWDVLRTEAGLPVYGVDIDETTTLPELGQRGISYDKGCYIGQEVVARIKYLGHVNRQFVGFVCDELPEIRDAVYSGGKEVGYVTTRVVSPGLGKPIALGFVNRMAATAGTEVELVHGEKRISAQVTALPFVLPSFPAD